MTTPSNYRRKSKSTRRRNKKQDLVSSKNINILESCAVSPSKKVEDAVENVNVCSTPKAERFRIPEIGSCPPAPKKRRIRAAATYSYRPTAQPLPFFTPPDIELFFYFALRGVPV